MNKKKWRKLISIAMSLITVVSLCLNMTNSFAVEDNLNTQADGEIYTWDESTGTLTIIGSTGDYTMSTAKNALYYEHKNDTKKIVINGDSNTIVGSYAFYQFSQLESIEIKTCGEIKDHAFNFCSKLQTITINTCGDIGDRAFSQCNKLESFIVTGSCGDFGPYVFQNASALKTIEIQNAGNIDDSYVFSGANAIESFVIKGQCGNIGNRVLYNKDKLITVSINSCGNIGESAFDGCNYLSSLTLNTIGDIGKKAFFDCSSLETIEITKCGNIGNSAFGKTGKNITIKECGNINSQAFVDNSNTFGGGPLESIHIDQCGSIGGSAFISLNNLKNVYIDQCQSVGSQAFAFCSALQNVTINNCASIGDTAFMSAGAPIEELTIKNCVIEKSAFYMVKINTLNLDSISQIGDNAFQSSTITHLTLSNIDKLGKSTFAGCKGLTTLTIKNLDEINENTFEIYDETLGNNVIEINLKDVRYIGNYAFMGFNNLKVANIDESCQYIGAHAFSGCEKLETIHISDATKLGYSDSFVNQEYVHNRVIDILKGKFQLLDMSQPIESINADGWTSVQIGEKNATQKVGDTQITKEAKWEDSDKTIANVKMKAYYTVNQQMDFIFVADCSNSMSGFGSSDAMNSNFYNMQSKMIDVVDEVLTDKNLDTKVAFSTFGENESSQSSFFGKNEVEQAKEYIWNDIVNYYSNTNYSHGLEEALKLVQQNKDRNTTVIFISDGQPYYPGEVPEEYYGVEEANAIKAEGAQIISVLQQVSENQLESSIANMEKIADQIYYSTDLEGFSQAINDAIDYAYTSYTITDTISSDFVLDEESISASAGNVSVAKNSDGLTTITWTISGHPFEELVLTFNEKLKADKTGDYPEGNLYTNDGYAILSNGVTDINKVASPVLPREAQQLHIDKQWVNDDVSHRPENIQVAVMRDGQLYKTLTLSHDTNWEATLVFDLTDHMNDYQWTVEELNIPKGYSCSIKEKDGGWTIVNTLKLPEIIVIPEEPDKIKPTLPDKNEPIVSEKEETIEKVQTSDTTSIRGYVLLTGIALAGVLYLIKSKKDYE